MKLKHGAKAALAVVAAAALVVGLTQPASAATRSTVVIIDSNTFTSLNSNTTEHNLVLNSNVGYMTGIGFNYYNDKPELIENKTFGSYKIISKSPFKVKYTVNKGRVWSDGTPITGVDLLLTHVVSSNQYSIDAGLGDPKSKTQTPVFDSGGYSRTYNTLIKDVTLAPDRMSVVVEWKSFFPDWEVYAPGVSPVHALVALAEGKTKLGTNANNVANKNKFLRAFLAKDTDMLTKIGKVWTNSYNLKEINDKTNPLLLVANGAMMVESVVRDQRVTLKLNPRYNSGPKTSGVEKIVFVTIADPTAAAQALANKEADLYSAIATADSVAQLNKIKGITLDGAPEATHELIQVRIGAAPGGDPYKGPFAGMSQKAVDLRTAFLLAYPRQEIIDKIVKPVNPKAVVMNAVEYYPTQPNYAKAIAKNGMDKFTDGTQAQRTAKALALVKKYFPEAKDGSGSVKVKLLWGQPSNTRRAAQAALVKAGLAEAGFDVDITPTQGWSAFTTDSKFDAAFHAWGKGSLLQAGIYSEFKSSVSDWGFSNAKFDEIVEELEVGNFTDAQKLSRYIELDSLMADAATHLPIFQWPGLTVYNSDLKNVSPAPLVPNALWNFWEWKY
jgi:peptide/nickel transport system substrate-binding protein